MKIIPATSGSTAFPISFTSYVVLIVAVITNFATPVQSFSSSLPSATIESQRTCLPRNQYQYCHWQYSKPPTLSSPLLVLQVSKLRDDDVAITDDFDENDDDDDEELLRQTPKSELVALCENFELSTEGAKEELLLRLRAYADSKLEEEQQRLDERNKRIEDGGGDNDREKYELVNSEDAEDEEGDDGDGVFFYFETKDKIPEFKDDSRKVDGDQRDRSTDVVSQQRSNNRPITQDVLTAPPPPPEIEPNEDGERVVTVYSTTDQNDLTGVAAAQPGQASEYDPMTGPVVEPENTPWDFENGQGGAGNQKSEASEEEMQAAKEEVTELVSSLLAMTGAPGFVHSDGSEDDDNEVLSSVGIFRQQKAAPSSTSYVAPEGFVGFDPTKVSTDTLNKASRSLRMGRGSVLMDVTREFELRAVGYDGAFGDDEKRGGGHYRQVSLIRSFLEGFRRAEVRRLARETATMLLDRLVQDGIEGLDQTLSTMSRVGDDVNLEAGELNDSLLDYLNDAIRQQERKVEQVIDSVKKMEELERSVEDFDGDQLEKLWTVEDEDGKRVETFDPKDPKNKMALQDEYEKDFNERSMQIKRAMLPASAQERLLLLLKLLRERVKIEAAFAHDEKSRNLRVLAYCLNINSDDLRKELIIKEFGGSLDVSRSIRIVTCHWFFVAGIAI